MWGAWEEIHYAKNCRVYQPHGLGRSTFLITFQLNKASEKPTTAKETDQAVHVIHHAFLSFPLLLLARLSLTVHRPVAPAMLLLSILGDKNVVARARERERAYVGTQLYVGEVFKLHDSGVLRALIEPAITCPVREQADARARDQKIPQISTMVENVMEEEDVKVRHLSKGFRILQPWAFYEGL